MDDRVLRASELGQYDFCAKAWWLGSVEGQPSANAAELEAGTQWHAGHGRAVSRAGRVQQLAIMLLLLGVILLAAFLVTNGF